MHRQGTLAGVLTVVGVALATAPSADARSLGTVKAPGATAPSHTRATAVVVRMAPGARLVRAHIDNHPLRLRRSGRTLRARVPRSRAGAGLHTLGVELRRAGRRETLTRRFAVAGRRARLVRVSAPRRARRAPVAVRVRQNRDELLERLVVRLNGRTVTRHFVDSSGFAERDRLSARHGLRHGVNRLVVLALGRNGTWDRERRRIVLRRGVPIPDAGRDRRIVAGHHVRLRPDGPRDTLRLVRRPRGSSAEIRGGRLVTDRPGRYQVSHVRQRGAQRSGADVMEVSATPDVLPIGVPIDTMATQGGARGTQIGDNFYPRTAGWIQMLQIDRTTATVVNQWSYSSVDPASLEIMAGDFKSQSSGSMFVIAADATEFTGTQATGWDSLGSSDQIYFGGGAFSVIGVLGIPQGQAWVNMTYRTLDGTYGALEGYLSLDSTTTNFQFTPPDVIGFDTNTTSAGEGATTATATVAGQPYSITIEQSGGAGFLVVALDAGTLQPIATTGYATLNSGNDAGNQEDMASWLQNWTDKPWVLVIVQSIGHVKPNEPQWDLIADQLAALGGSEHVFNTVDGGYSFVGGAGGGPAAETSTTLYPSVPGPVGTRLVGVLERNNDFRMTPTLHGSMTNSNTFPDFELAELAYQPAQAWPNGTSGGTGAANAYIAQAIGILPDGNGNYDVRDGYTDDGFDFASEVAVHKFTCPKDGGSGFTYDDCKTMEKQFTDEGEYLGQVNKYLDSNGLLQGPITDSQTAKSNLLNQIAKSVEAAVTPPAGGLIVDWESIVEEVVDDVAIIAGFVTGGEAAAGVLGFVASAFGIAGSFTKNPDGSLATQLSVEADDLATQADESFSATLGAISQLRAVIATDYGKLTEFAAKAGDDPNWNLSNGSVPADALESAAKQGFYEALLGVAYYSVSVPQQYCGHYALGGMCDGGSYNTTDARDFNCYHDKWVEYNTTPYSDTAADDSGQFQAVVEFNDDMTPIYGIQVIIQAGTTWTMPDASFLDALYAVPQNADDLNGGFAKVELWPGAWPDPLTFEDWRSTYGGCTS